MRNIITLLTFLLIYMIDETAIVINKSDDYILDSSQSKKRLQFESKDYDKAISKFQKILKNRPNNKYTRKKLSITTN